MPATGQTMFQTAKSTVSIHHDQFKPTDQHINVWLPNANHFHQQINRRAAICKDTPNGLVFIEKSCVRYWLCVGGYPRLQRCPAGLAVNPTSLKCELASTVPGW